MPITVKPFFVLFSIKKIHLIQLFIEFSREFISLHSTQCRSRGETLYRYILWFTGYPHYVLLTLNYVSLSGRSALLKCAQAAQLFPQRA
jgi:hypothetical protein